MRPLRAAATALVAVLALSSCNGGNDPAEPSPTAKPSSSSSAPTTAPPTETLTEAPRGETARQFIRRWVELGNQMQTSGETAGFLAVAGPDCQSCVDFASQVAEIYKGGGRIETDGSDVVRLHHDGGDQWTVSLTGAPTEVTASAGSSPSSLPGGDYQLIVYVAKAQDLWIVGDYQDRR